MHVRHTVFHPFTRKGNESVAPLGMTYFVALSSFWAFVAFFLAFFVFAIPNLYFALRPALPRLVVDVSAGPRRSAPPTGRSQGSPLQAYFLAVHFRVNPSPEALIPSVQTR